MWMTGDPEIKNLPANARDARDIGLNPGLGRFPGVGNGNLFEYSYLVIPWMEEPGGLQCMGLQRVRHD